MTKAQLIEALNKIADDDDILVCADEEGGWDNIIEVRVVNGMKAIVFGGGSPFSDE